MYRRTFIVIGFSVGLSSAANRPITERALIDALKIGGLKPHELVRKIKERGVNFIVSPDVERRLLRAGAVPEVIEAARANYRKA